MAEKRALGYLDGLGTGIAAIALVVLGVLALVDKHAEIYEEIKVALPLSSRIVMHPAFSFGAPLVVAALLVVAHLRRSYRYAILAIACLAVALAVFTFVGMWAPIWQLSGEIR